MLTNKILEAGPRGLACVGTTAAAPTGTSSRCSLRAFFQQQLRLRLQAAAAAGEAAAAAERASSFACAEEGGGMI